MTQIDRIIETAKSFLGSLENSEQHREIINLYNQARDPAAYVMTMNDPWCAAFVVAVFQKCGLANLVPCYASCDQMVTWFKKRDQLISWKESPHVGDIIFYNWDDDATMDHTGIVVKNQFGNLSVIEGNASDTVKYRNIHYTNAMIKCYGRPTYSQSTEKPQAPALEVSPYSTLSASDKSTINSFPLLYEGCKGIWVKILQTMLRELDGADLDIDGEFGPITKKWVMQRQVTLLLEVDGKVGKETWSSFFTI